uniref:Uncharacterized protein n=1 Tax=Steinernema glaseri TaxID=37863 RepID=A0A1I7YDQ0_9BILA
MYFAVVDLCPTTSLTHQLVWQTGTTPARTGWEQRLGARNQPSVACRLGSPRSLSLVLCWKTRLPRSSLFLNKVNLQLDGLSMNSALLCCDGKSLLIAKKFTIKNECSYADFCSWDDDPTTADSQLHTMILVASFQMSARDRPRKDLHPQGLKEFRFPSSGTCGTGALRQP